MKTVTVWLMDDDSLEAKPVVHTNSNIYMNDTFISVHQPSGATTGYRVMDVKKFEIVVVDE